MSTSTLPRGYDRRAVLKATGIVGLAVGGLAIAAPTMARAALPAGGPRIDLTSPNHTLFEHKSLHHSQRVIRSLAFDNANRRLFILQARTDGAVGDLCLNRVSMSGALLGTMHVNHAGHGLSFGVESVGSDSYIWMEGKANSAGNATALQRFKWVPGRAPAAPQTFFAGSKNITCAVDPVNQRLLVRNLTTTGYKHRVYKLPFGKPASMTLLSSFSLPAAVTNLGTLRGYAPYGRHLYIFTGSPQRSSANINSRITVMDMDTRKVVSSTTTYAGRRLAYRAPKGLAIYATPAGVGLYLGIASRTTYGASRDYANVYFKDDMTGVGVITNAPGATLHAVAGTNVNRNTNEIVRYTRTSTQTRTPTNQFGVEVSVNSASNKVTAVNNRLATGNTTGTAIPSGTYILSGHGTGSGTAGQWLLNFAAVGRLVTLNIKTSTPPPAAETTNLRYRQGLVLGANYPKPTNTTCGLLLDVARATFVGNVTPTSGQTISNKDITGLVNINSGVRDVTFRNCRFRGTKTAPAGHRGIVNIYASTTTANIKFEDCLFQPDVPHYRWTGITGHHFTLTRCTIRNTTDGFGVFNGAAPGTDVAVHVVGSWVDKLAKWSNDGGAHADGTHNDGFQIQGGFNVEILNSLINPNLNPDVGNTNGQNCKSGGTLCSPAMYTGNACVQLNKNVGQMGGLSVRHSWLYGGAITVNGLSINDPVTLAFQNNRFGRDSYYKVPGRIAAGPNVTWSGNTYEDNGASVPLLRR